MSSLHPYQVKLYSINGVNHDILCELLSRLCIENDPIADTSKDGCRSLAIILKQTSPQDHALLSRSYNKDKIFSDSGCVRRSIDIKSLDTTLLSDIILTEQCLDVALKNKSFSCRADGHMSKCCENCNHICMTCNNANCAKKITVKSKEPKICCTPGASRCNHACVCGTLYSDCYNASRVCCRECSTCSKCAASLVEDKQCPKYILRKAVMTIKHLRNLSAHVTEKEFQLFKEGKIRLSNFPNCNNWNALSVQILKSYENCLAYLCNEKNFKKQQSVSETEKLEREQAIRSVLNDTTDTLKKHFSCGIHQTQLFILEEQQRFKEYFVKQTRSIQWQMVEQADKVREVQRIVLELQEKASRQDISEVYLKNLIEHNIQTLLQCCNCRIDVSSQEYPDIEKVFIQSRTEDGCLLQLPATKCEVVSKVEVADEVNDWTEISTIFINNIPNYVIVKVQGLTNHAVLYKIKVTLQDTAVKDNKRIVEFEEFRISNDRDMKHSKVLNGFGLLCHASGVTTDPCEVIPTLQLKLKTPQQVYHEVSIGGAGIYRTLEDWYKTCDLFLLRNFSLPRYIKGTGQNTNCFGQVIRISSGDVNIAEMSSIADMFEEWCSSQSTLTNAPALLVLGYDMIRHYQFLGFERDNVLSSLKILKQQACDNTILVYEPKQNILICVRISNETDMVMLQNAVQACQDDLKLFCGLNLEVLNNSGLVLIGLVIATRLTDDKNNGFIEEEGSTFCGRCRNFIVSHQTMTNFESFKGWWDKSMQRTIDNMRREGGLKVGKWTERLNKFRMIASRTVGFIAATDVCLPSLSANVSEQVKTVMLTKEQMNAVQSKDKHVIILGGYGSGKSLVALKKLEVIATSSENITLYYICSDVNTLFQHEMKLHADKTANNKGKGVNLIVMNRFELCLYLGLKETSPLSSILLGLHEKHKDSSSCHAIFEEYDGEKLDKEEGQRIKTALEKMTNSWIVIVAQSLEKRREMVCYKDEEDEVLPHNKYNYSSTGMKVIELTKTMRTTIEINQLMMIAAKFVVEKFKSEFTHPTIFDQRGDSIAESDCQRSAQEFDDLGCMQDGGDGRMKDMVVSEDFKHFKNTNNFIIEYDLDYMFKLLDGLECGENSPKTISSFLYSGTFITGHSITGSKPVVAQPFNDSMKFDSIDALRLMVTLEQLIEQPQKTVIICFHPLQCLLIWSALKVLGISYVSRVPAFFKEKSTGKGDVFKFLNHETFILVADYGSVRGIECDKVIVAIDRKEHYLLHYVIDASSRCTSNLSFILFDAATSVASPQSSITMQDIVDEWITRVLVDLMVVTECSECKNDESPDDNLFCEQQDEWCTAYSIHTYYPKYEDMKRNLGTISHTDVQLVDENDVLEMCKSDILFPAMQDTAKENQPATDRTDPSEMSDRNEQNWIVQYNETGFPYVQEIIAKDQEEILKFLLRNDPDLVFGRNPRNGESPLHEAASLGRKAIVQLLLRARANPAATNRISESTPYHCAAAKGKAACLDILLQHDPSKVDMKDRNFRTPLWWAAYLGHDDCVNVLLKYRPDVNRKDNEKNSPIDVAHTQEIKNSLRYNVKPRGTYA